MALIGTATGVNFNATGDTAISITDPGDGKYVITGICVSNASANPASGFRGWLYAEEGGVDPIGAPMNFGSNLPDSAKAQLLGMLGSSWGNQDVQTGSTTIYFHVGTANGAPCTADIAIFGEPIA